MFDFFKTIAHKVGDFGKTIFRGVKKAVPKIEKTISNVTSTVYKDTKGAVSYVATRPQYYFDKTVGLVDKGIATTGNTVSNLGSSLSTPLTIGLGVAALGGIYVLAK